MFFQHLFNRGDDKPVYSYPQKAKAIAKGSMIIVNKIKKLKQWEWSICAVPRSGSTNQTPTGITDGTTMIS